MKLLILGGCGFLGSNLARHGIENGFDVTVFDNLSRLGTEKNLLWLREAGEFDFVHGDVRNRNDVENLVRSAQPEAIFHLAGQVAMTTSLDNPYMDFEVNVGGTINLLEAVRAGCPEASVFYSSTNKVYGDLEYFSYKELDKRYVCVDCPNGFDESVQLSFHSPYGCSKGAADQYLLDYARMYGLKTTVFRHSSMYGGRQFSTADQGWIGWFCQQAIEQSKNNKSRFTISGNGKQVRDVLHAEDMISLYFGALNNVGAVAGRAYNIGGGQKNSLSLIELFDFLNSELDIELKYERLPARASDQKVFIADISSITSDIGWEPNVDKYSGVSRMLSWVQECR